MVGLQRVGACRGLNMVCILCALASFAAEPSSTAKTPQTPKKSSGVTRQPLKPADLYRQLAPSVVVIEARVPNGLSQGSGVVVGNGEIITNNHVVSGATNFIIIRQGQFTWRGEVSAFDPAKDLALIQVVLRKSERFDLPITRRRVGEPLLIGEKVYAIGAPRGLAQTLSEGIISGLPNLDSETLIQTTAAISPGSSGGGLFDERGRLVGITTIYLRDSQSINFAVSSEHIQQLQEDSRFIPDYSVSDTHQAGSIQEQPASNTERKPDLPTSLKDTHAIRLIVDVDGPVAVQGGLTADWIRSHAASRLNRSGVATYLDSDTAVNAGVYALPLYIHVSSLHISDSYLYVWQLDLNLLDSADFSDGSNQLVNIWTNGTHGYGGSKVVTTQVAAALDEYIDKFTIALLKARQK